jgi:hypothetical protein
MTDVLAPLLIVGGVLAVPAGLVWISIRARRRGLAGAAMRAAMAAYSEAFQATAHHAYAEIQAQGRRMTPRPSADGGPSTRPELTAGNGSGAAPSR